MKLFVSHCGQPLFLKESAYNRLCDSLPVKESMDVRAVDMISLASIHLGQVRAVLLHHIGQGRHRADRLAHVDFVSLDLHARKLLQDSANGGTGTGHPGSRLLFPEYGPYRKKLKPLHRPPSVGFRLHTERVLQAFSQHLKAAADSEHRNAGGRQLQYCRLQAILPHPE